MVLLGHLLLALQIYFFKDTTTRTVFRSTAKIQLSLDLVGTQRWGESVATEDPFGNTAKTATPTSSSPLTLIGWSGPTMKRLADGWEGMGAGWKRFHEQTGDGERIWRAINGLMTQL